MSSELESLRIKNEMETKQKLVKERHLHTQRHTKRTYCDAMHSANLEILNLTEQLQDLKDKASKTQREISRLRMQNSSQKAKFDTSIAFLDTHRKEFQEKFEKEATLSELRHRQQQDLEAADAEVSRQKQKRVDEQSARCARDVARVEEETADIQRECAILRKRNNAIMLKLRRKLVNTKECWRRLKDNEAE